MSLRSTAAIVLAAISLPVASAAPIIVPTNARAPQDEQKAFHLPPNFEIQLVASEPDIQKPMNMAFDEKGRLWLTDTIEYPFPVSPDKVGRDTVKILEDFAPHGKAQKISTFATGLNIPIGILPHGSGAIVFSIPNLWTLSDTTGAGRSDQRKILMGTIGQRDTHGLTNSFTEGFDGWIYACHGFSNDSVLKASDGSEIHLNSGNTYRFKPDGSHVEFFTHGQVNPFGLIFDPLGDLYSSDCHTMPITLLQRGGYYQSFGKPDDGLGMAPDIVDHFYDSTAIAGIEMYSADRFPAQYQGHMFVGNVMTTLINQAVLQPRGSAYIGADQPPFLSCTDEWFRPTQIKLGPDGALYVADFYNKIIGHYEVDLKHPGRDRSSGRIWRIAYKGPDVPQRPDKKFDLTTLSLPDLIATLADPNMTARMLAMNRLADVVGKPAIEPLKQAMAATDSNVWLRVHGLWILQRLNALDDETVKALATDPNLPVRVHLLRALAETPDWTNLHYAIAVANVVGPDPLLMRCAAEAIGQHPSRATLRPLLIARAKPDLDPHLLYALRIALRNHLLLPNIGNNLADLTDADNRALADVALGAPTPEAATFLLKYLRSAKESRATAEKYLKHIARYVPAEQLDAVAAVIPQRFPADTDLQLALFKSIQDGLTQRGGQISPALRNWGKTLVTACMDVPPESPSDWTTSPLPGAEGNFTDPWVLQSRNSADNVTAPFFCSLPKGEQLTGVIRSATFKLPAKLSFYAAGHNGQPPAHLPIKNTIRLISADTKAVLIESVPPRNDLAQNIEWNLAKFQGQNAYVEVTDGDTGDAYAWLAFGRFSPDLIRIPNSLDTARQRRASALELVATLKLDDLAPTAEKLLTTSSTDTPSRIAAAKALASLGAEAHITPLTTALNDASAPDSVREAAATSLSQSSVTAALVEAMRAVPNKLQLSIARSLAMTPPGANALLDAIQQGKASPRLLQDRAVKERLANARIDKLAERITALTQNLPDVSAELQKLIDQRAASFNPSAASPTRGQKVFTTNCAICHKLAGEGAQVGPQLDGIGKRGPARLAEDILDPSRNVDQAFRSSTFFLTKGDPIDGLVRSEQGETIIVVDTQGKENPIPKSKIKKRIDSKLSLMPSNFSELLKAEDFNDLISFLLSK